MPNEIEPTSRDKWTEKARPFLSASVLVGIAALGVSVAQSGLGFLNYVRTELSSNAECCESFRAYRTEDSGQRKFWVGEITKQGERIIRNHEICNERMRKMEARVVELETEVRLLQRQPAARPDPFTGTQGRELERRIKALESP
jgi:hypothetical protein